MGAGGVLPGVRGWVQPRLCCRHRAEQLLPRSALRRLCLKLEELESIVCKYRPRLAFCCAGTSQRAPTLSQHAEPAGQAPSPGCEAVVARGEPSKASLVQGGSGTPRCRTPPGQQGPGGDTEVAVGGCWPGLPSLCAQAGSQAVRVMLQGEQDPPRNQTALVDASRSTVTYYITSRSNRSAVVLYDSQNVSVPEQGKKQPAPAPRPSVPPVPHSPGGHPGDKQPQPARDAPCAKPRWLLHRGEMRHTREGCPRLGSRGSALPALTGHVLSPRATSATGPRSSTPATCAGWSPGTVRARRGP